MRNLSRSRLILLLPLCGLAAGCQGGISQLDEASGVCRQGENLLIVGDAETRGYYEVPIRHREGGFLPLDPESGTLVLVPHPELADDLEGIDILADERVVVLSESRYCLVSVDGLVVQYDETLAPVSGRGLEGLAIRPSNQGGSWVAVMWEGGYPRPDRPLPQSKVEDRLPMLPMFVVHELAEGATSFMHTLAEDPALPLRVPTPEGDEPHTPRFRAPDLVWHRLPDGTWGFIVLLSSENLAGDPLSRLRIIQRFDAQGYPIGEPLDIEELLPDTMQHLNWEGLGWFEPGKSLVTVHDDGGEDLVSEAFVIPLPDGW